MISHLTHVLCIVFVRIRDITKEVAAAVVREAVKEDLAEGYRGTDPRELQRLDEVQ
jgi:malate dehydrogenase (decarboxylating)